eukprot:4313760-Ditylum_brightwellii.AAC.1
MKELLAKGKKLSNEEGKDGLDEAEDDYKDTAINKADFKGLGGEIEVCSKRIRGPRMFPLHTGNNST